MTILIPIGLLPTTLHNNDGQNKLEISISKNMAKTANNGPKLAAHGPLLANLRVAITWSPYIRFGQMSPLK